MGKKTEEQFDTFSKGRSNGYEQVGDGGDTVVMRKDVSSNPNVRSYEYVEIDRDGKAHKR